jgi:hypothetical protein
VTRLNEGRGGKKAPERTTLQQNVGNASVVQVELKTVKFSLSLHVYHATNI